MGHPAGYDIPRRQFLFFRLVAVHEPLAVDVLEGPAVAPAPLGNQDVGGDDAGWMELHGLRVADRDQSGIQGDDRAVAGVYDRIGGFPVQAPVAAGGDQGGPGQVDTELSGFEATGYNAHAGLAVMNERYRLDPVVHRYAEANDFVVHGKQECVARPIGGVAGAPFGRSTEIARRYETLPFLCLDLFVLFSGLVINGFPGDHAVPGNAPVRHLAHRYGRRFSEHASDFLVAAPVGTFYRIGEVHVRAVSLAPAGVAQRGLHAALSGGGVGTPRGDNAQADGFVSGRSRRHRHALAGKPRSHAQKISVYGVQFSAPYIALTKKKKVKSVIRPIPIMVRVSLFSKP